MINQIIALLGDYVPLAGDGIASLNWVWLLSALLLVIGVWFIFRFLLKFIDWMLK